MRASSKHGLQSAAIDEGKEVHGEISRQGLLENDIVLGGALMHMYGKCGPLRQAQSVLEKILSHAKCHQAHLDCFKQMQRKGILSTEVTYVCILKAWAATAAIDEGKEVHGEISRQGLLENDIVLGGALMHKVS